MMRYSKPTANPNFRRILGLLSLSLLLGLLVACGDETATPAPAATTAKAVTTAAAAATTASAASTTAAVAGAATSGDEIKIGVVVSATGPNASLGAPQRNSLLLAQEQLNAKGGINGKKVNLVILDDESKDDLAASHIKKLINEEKVIAIIGSSGSGPSLAMAPIAQESQIPMLSMGSTFKLMEPVQKWIFKSPPNDVLYWNQLFDFFKEKNYKKLALLHDSNAYGVSGKDFLQKLGPEKGFEITGVESYDSKAVDTKTQLTKLQASKPDAYIVWGTNPGPAIAAKNRSDLGIETPFFVSGGAANQQFLDVAGDAANGVYTGAGKILVSEALPDGDPIKPLVSQYLKDYKAKFGSDSNQFGSFAWDNFNILTAAIAKAGPDKAKIRDAIEQTTGFAGTQAVYNYTAADHNGLEGNKTALVMILVKDKKFSLQGVWK